MRGTLIFAGSSCPALTNQICENLGMAPADAELTQFSNGETSVRILTSVREKDVFIVQSGSTTINDTIMELLVMISACKGGSANKITAVLPYFPYSRQSKKKSHRGAITARLLANLLGVAGVKHVVTVDLHASQMQGFFKCPVDNLHAEPLIAKWIKRNIPNWKDAVVVSKNAGGTKRVTSLADALKLNFGMVTTDKKRGSNMTMSVIMNHLDGFERAPALEGSSYRGARTLPDSFGPFGGDSGTPTRPARGFTDAPRDSPIQVESPPIRTANLGRSSHIHPTTTPTNSSPVDAPGDESETPGEDEVVERGVTQGRLVEGHVVDDSFPSPALSTADNSTAEDDAMIMSHASSFFAPGGQSMGGSGDGESDEEDEVIKKPGIEHMITLVGDVSSRPVFIVDDMIDKPGSWIAAAETVVKRGRASKVYVMGTHGIFGGDCLEQLEACECIDTIVVTNSFPIPEEKARRASKLVILDLSYLLAEAIRRNHYGESISPLFMHLD